MGNTRALRCSDLMTDAASDFLAADWGTSNLRAWRLGADGTVKDVRRLPWGVAGLEPGEAALRLKDELRPALGAEDLPAILCGMVGSAMGIAEARYADCPAGARGAGPRLLQIDAQTFIVPGLRCVRPDGYPDVIRGEETKVLGWLALDPRRAEGDHVLCLPGTHGKWVLVREGRIHHFMTCMSGELFALLSEHSVLKPGAPPSDEASFAEGLKLGAADSPLASRLFTVRARMVGPGAAGRQGGLLPVGPADRRRSRPSAALAGTQSRLHHRPDGRAGPVRPLRARAGGPGAQGRERGWRGGGDRGSQPAAPRGSGT